MIARRFIHAFTVIAFCFSLLSCSRTPDIDEVGGHILVYEMVGDDNSEDVDFTLRVLRRRLDRSRRSGVTVQSLGENRIEVLIPGLDPKQYKRTRRIIETVGHLEFLILANSSDHQNLIQHAKDESQKNATTVRDKEDKAIGKWVRVEKVVDPNGQEDFKARVVHGVIRDSESREWLSIPQVDVHVGDGSTAFGENRSTFTEYLLNEYPCEDGTAGGVSDIEVLVGFDKINLTGMDLASVRTSADERGRPSINFDATAPGAQKFKKITRKYKPSNGVSRCMCIILDDRLLSAPMIQGEIGAFGRITGEFTMEEVDFIVYVLRAGRLPVELKLPPVDVVKVKPKK